MRATELIRALLDVIDEKDSQRYTQDDEDARFEQILDLLQSNNEMPLANTPNEVVADVDAVTTLAGGGVNGPKHQADIRVKDPGYGHGG
jgi:hypothetical protein